MQNYYKINSKSLSILKGTDSEVVFNAVAVTLSVLWNSASIKTKYRVCFATNAALKFSK